MRERVHFISERKCRGAVRALWEAHAARLRKLLPRVDLQHVGSTAIPGSLTKGDLDIQARVPAETFAEAERILAVEYDRNTRSTHTREFAAFEGRDTKPKLGIQLTAIGGQFDVFWRYREVLLAREDLRRAFDALKRDSEGKDMECYRRAKDAFFNELQKAPEYASATIGFAKGERRRRAR